MNFSAILDISSFFIGMIINLLLIALICYYFKRKYENLEIAQNEQAKVLYQLLQQNTQPKVMNLNDILKVDETNLDIELNEESDEETDDGSESGSDEETVCSESKSKSDHTDRNISVLETPKFNEIKKIILNETDDVKEKSDKQEKPEKMDLKLDMDLDIEEINVAVSEVDLQLTDEKDYSKMNIKQLKEILSVKGINANKMKKNEMIELIEKSSTSIDE